MHTPGHAVINLAAIGSCTDATVGAPILAGAIIPDLPIVLLYIAERWVRRTPEDVIWRVHYQRRFWQDLVHGLHSIPLALLGLVVSALLASPGFTAFFASLLLHASADLPLHGEDAHRHFFPFSHYRFISPISYWDARRHGAKVAAVEASLVFASSAWLWSSSGELGRVALLLVDVGYVVSYWRAFVRPSMRHALRS